MTERPKIVIERTYATTPEVLWDLWTTPEGFASWWGPRGFRVEVYALEPKPGGLLRYEMIADAPEMVEAMRQSGQPVSHGVTARFGVFEPRARLSIVNTMDFIPGVAAYEATIDVTLEPRGGRVRMVVALDPLHADEWSQMQKAGFTSQLGKLDDRFGAEGSAAADTHTG